jgi:Tfp pilus assembly protein PilN
MTMPNHEVSAAAQTVVLTGLPRVNLMPPEIAEAARFRRFQLAMGAAAVAAVAIVGALYVHEHSAVKSAQSDLDTAKARQAALQSQLSSLQSVQDVYTTVAARQAMLQQAMGGEIRWSRYLSDLSLKVPDHVWLTSLSASEGDSTSQPTGALSTGTVGSIQFAGVGYSHNDVATWLDVLAKERGFVNPYFTSSVETPIGDKPFETFASSVDINDKTESGRYTKPAGS